MKRLKRLFILFMLAAALFAGYRLKGFIQSFPENTLKTALPQPVYEPLGVVGNVRMTEAVIEEIRATNRLVVFEADFFEDILLDDSFLEHEIFQKQQRITFFGTGAFAVDLSDISPADIEIDPGDLKAYISIPEPQPGEVSLNHDKTIQHDPQNGLLRFGSIKLAPSDYEDMANKAVAAMALKLAEGENVAIARNNAHKALSRLLTSTLEVAGFPGYTIYIAWLE